MVKLMNYGGGVCNQPRNESRVRIGSKYAHRLTFTKFKLAKILHNQRRTKMRVKREKSYQGRKNKEWWLHHRVGRLPELQSGRWLTGELVWGGGSGG